MEGNSINKGNNGPKTEKPQEFLVDPSVEQKVANEIEVLENTMRKADKTKNEGIWTKANKERQELMSYGELLGQIEFLGVQMDKAEANNNEKKYLQIEAQRKALQKLYIEKVNNISEQSESVEKPHKKEVRSDSEEVKNEIKSRLKDRKENTGFQEYIKREKEVENNIKEKDQIDTSLLNNQENFVNPNGVATVPVFPDSVTMNYENLDDFAGIKQEKSENQEEPETAPENLEEEAKLDPENQEKEKPESVEKPEEEEKTKPQGQEKPKEVENNIEEKDQIDTGSLNNQENFVNPNGVATVPVFPDSVTMNYENLDDFAGIKQEKSENQEKEKPQEKEEELDPENQEKEKPEEEEETKPQGQKKPQEKEGISDELRENISKINEIKRLIKEKTEEREKQREIYGERTGIKKLTGLFSSEEKRKDKELEKEITDLWEQRAQLLIERNKNQKNKLSEKSLERKPSDFAKRLKQLERRDFKTYQAKEKTKDQQKDLEGFKGKEGFYSKFLKTITPESIEKSPFLNRMYKAAVTGALTSTVFAGSAPIRVLGALVGAGTGFFVGNAVKPLANWAYGVNKEKAKRAEFMEDKHIDEYISNLGIKSMSAEEFNKMLLKNKKDLTRAEKATYYTTSGAAFAAAVIAGGSVRSLDGASNAVPAQGTQILNLNIYMNQFQNWCSGVIHKCCPGLVASCAVPDVSANPDSIFGDGFDGDDSASDEIFTSNFENNYQNMVNSTYPDGYTVNTGDNMYDIVKKELLKGTLKLDQGPNALTDGQLENLTGNIMDKLRDGLRNGSIQEDGWPADLSKITKGQTIDMKELLKIAQESGVTDEQTGTSYGDLFSRAKEAPDDISVDPRDNDWNWTKKGGVAVDDYQGVPVEYANTGIDDNYQGVPVENTVTNGDQGVPVQEQQPTAEHSSDQANNLPSSVHESVKVTEINGVKYLTGTVNGEEIRIPVPLEDIEDKGSFQIVEGNTDKYAVAIKYDSSPNEVYGLEYKDAKEVFNITAQVGKLAEQGATLFGDFKPNLQELIKEQFDLPDETSGLTTTDILKLPLKNLKKID